jgi:hypothetical protein
MNLYEQADGKDFFVRLKLREGIRIISKVKSAFTLYFWYVARTTVEYEFQGARIGGVYGLAPYTDQSIADDLEQSGTRCSVEQIRRYRATLTRKGYIAALRTPAGHRVMVLGSAKFVNKELKELPPWAIKLLHRRKSTVPARA